MPTPEQLRTQRIEEIFQEFNGRNVTLIDPILNRILVKYPTIRPERAREYAVAVLRMLKSQKKERKKEAEE